MTRRITFRAYVGGVSVAGTGLFALLMAADGLGAVLDAVWRLWPFTLFVFVGELLPVRVPRSGEIEEEITTSATFAFALLLGAGAASAALALVAASVAADVFRRKSPWKVWFNAAQYTLSVGGALAILAVFRVPQTFGPGEAFPVQDLAAILLAGAVYFLVGYLVTGVAIGAARGPGVLRRLFASFGVQAGTAGVLLALAPIVVVAADRSLWMVPLLGLPMLTVYQAARVWLEKETQEHEATHDSLTGLPNRSLFYARVRKAIEGGEGAGSFAIMIIDLDRFKEINDTLGHYAGDQLLRQVGPRVVEVLRDEDVIARLGGDEFAVLVPGIPNHATALQVAQRIQEALEVPFTVEGLLLDVDASVGIALYPDHGVNLDDLIRRADVAMYLAKEAGSGYEMYAPERDQHSLGRLTLLGELRRGIDRGELLLEFQPKAELRAGRVVAAEALVRWHHPREGVLAPDRFIPLAERTGLMRPLTLFVLNEALRECREWHAMGAALGVAVNLSARNLMDLRFPEEVQRLLSTWQIAPGWLELEITESAVMADPARSMHVLGGLAEIGVGVSLDDFGTGYSSLIYLKRLPVNEVKIDKSFITDMMEQPNDALIVESTIELAKSLGLRVVAEGVETEQVWEQLRRLGCDMAQGYHLSRPMPGPELLAWLQSAEPEGGSIRVVS